MKTHKRVLRPERLRQVPEQFIWVDQGLVQRHLIAYEAPVYQVLGRPGVQARAPRSAPAARPSSPVLPCAPPPAREATGPVSLGNLLEPVGAQPCSTMRPTASSATTWGASAREQRLMVQWLARSPRAQAEW